MPLVIFEPFNASILSIKADVSASMHHLNLLRRPIAQYSSNWKTIFKDWMRHCASMADISGSVTVRY